MARNSKQFFKEQKYERCSAWTRKGHVLRGARLLGTAAPTQPFPGEINPPARPFPPRALRERARKPLVTLGDPFAQRAFTCGRARPPVSGRPRSRSPSHTQPEPHAALSPGPLAAFLPRGCRAQAGDGILGPCEPEFPCNALNALVCPCAGCRIQALNRPPTPTRRCPLDRNHGSAWRTPASSSFRGPWTVFIFSGTGGGCSASNTHTHQVRDFPVGCLRGLSGKTPTG